MSQLLAIASGGALGALFRFSVGLWVGRYQVAGSFPFGTFIVNVGGALLFGLIATLSAGKIGNQGWYAFGAIGFLGSFTTFSTFSWEAVKLFQSGRGRLALGYVFLSLITAFLAIILGAWLAGHLPHGSTELQK